jgi:2-aminoadipate transaminase
MAELHVPAPSFCLDSHDRLARLAAASPEVLSLAGGLPDPKLFPKRELGEALQGALARQGDAALQYGWPEGAEELREEVAKGLRARGADIDATRIVITSGAQQAILLALAAVPKKRTVAVDAESYPGALDAFRAARAELVSIGERADLSYVMPSVSNPRGLRMSAQERKGLLERASRHGGYVLEDDAYDGTCFSGEPSRPLVADLPERVFQIGSFSKTLCPGLRLGWLVPPPRLARSVLRRKRNQDLQANGLAQALLVEYLRGGHFEALKKRARARYRRNARELMASVRRHLPEFAFQPPIGGFSIWLESQIEQNSEELLAAAIRRGAAFDPGGMFSSVPRRKLAIRLCYSTIAAADIDEAVARVAQALADTLRTGRTSRYA